MLTSTAIHLLARGIPMSVERQQASIARHPNGARVAEFGVDASAAARVAGRSSVQ